MLPILCFRCSQISTPVEGLRCPHCDGDGYGTVMAENFDSSIPEYGNAGPEYYVTVEDASTQVSEKDLVPMEPTREASAQVSEEELEPVEPTREASTQTSDDDLPLQFAGSHGYENCTESESPSDYLKQLTNENQSSLQVNSNANESEFHDRSSDICNASTSQEATDHPHVALQQQRYRGEQSPIGECKIKYGSDELLKRQGTANPADPVNNVSKLHFTGSATHEAEDSIMHNFPGSSNNAEGRRERVNTPPSFSTLRRRNPPVSQFSQENVATANALVQQKPQTSYRRSKKICRSCKRHFMKESTFSAHAKSNCNPNPFKCGQCDERFLSMDLLIRHRRVHTGEKPFKCTQCDYASKWPHNLKQHLERHH